MNKMEGYRNQWKNIQYTFLIRLLTFSTTRTTYIKNKKLAEVGDRIEKGEVVHPKRTMEINHSIWLTTMGAGMGKMQWRNMKTSLKDLVDLPAWENMSAYWKKEILTNIYPTWRGEPRVLCGAVLDPKEFLPSYLARMLMRKDMEGKLPPEGYYKVQFKVISKVNSQALVPYFSLKSQEIKTKNKTKKGSNVGNLRKLEPRPNPRVLIKKT